MSNSNIKVITLAKQLKTNPRALAQQDPKAVANIIREWMGANAG